MYRNTGPDERVVLYQIPKTMFAANNPDPAQVVMNHPENRCSGITRYLNAVFLDRWQIPPDSVSARRCSGKCVILYGW